MNCLHNACGRQGNSPNYTCGYRGLQFWTEDFQLFDQRFQMQIKKKNLLIVKMSQS